MSYIKNNFYHLVAKQKTTNLAFTSTRVMVTKFWISLFLISTLTSCFVGAGTHGSIKGYQYNVTKNELENAVMYVIKNSPNIHRDTRGEPRIENVGNGIMDTIFDNSYNDGKNYVAIKINVKNLENEYTFRYYGDEEYWKTSKSSEIFICWEFDKGGNGGNEEYINSDDERRLTNIFETQFISLVDKQLNQTHITKLSEN